MREFGDLPSECPVERYVLGRRYEPFLGLYKLACQIFSERYPA